MNRCILRNGRWRVELQQLRYFLAVASLEHVNRAAAELHVSPSVISRAVTGLERELGVELFTRVGRVIRVNAFGRQFALSTGDLLRDLDAGVADVRQRAGIETGVVSVGFLGSLGAQVVPDLVRAHRHEHPSVDFALFERSGRQVVLDLLSGAFDVALGVPDLFDDGARVRWRALLRQQLVLVTAPGTPLARRPVVGLEELRDVELLTLTDDYTVRAVLDEACRRLGFAPRIAFEGTAVATLRGLARAGVGVAVLPPDPHDGSVCEVRVAGAALSRTIAVGRVRHRTLPLSSEVFFSSAAPITGDGPVAAARLVHPPG